MMAISTTDFKPELLMYLQRARDALVWKLDGLSEYDVRRPMTATGTNLLGMVKHMASVELGYFGACFGRPWPESLPWFDVGAEPNADMWATADESRESIVDLYRRSWRWADTTINDLPLDAVGRVPWWPEGKNEVTLHRILIHMIAETNRHAGHADILREQMDGAAGVAATNSNLPDADSSWWEAYRIKLELVAKASVGRSPDPMEETRPR
jgi:uncharacterized damage-inducible protein DinB